MSKIKTELVRLAFVNDTVLITNHESNDVAQVSQKMQHSLSMWHGLLQATGGELVPEKCFWYLIDFNWINYKWQYKRDMELPGQLSIEQEHGKIIIPQLETSKACRTLGVRIAPDGNNQMEAHHLQGVVVEWASHMARANLT